MRRITACTASSSALFTVAAAPSSSAFCRRLSITSVTNTFGTPRARSAIMDTRPMQPEPSTTARCPGPASAWLAAWKPTASGSMSAPSSVLTFSGSGKHRPASCATYSWNTPSTGGVAKNTTSGQRL